MKYDFEKKIEGNIYYVKVFHLIIVNTAVPAVLFLYTFVCD